MKTFLPIFATLILVVSVSPNAIAGSIIFPEEAIKPSVPTSKYLPKYSPEYNPITIGNHRRFKFIGSENFGPEELTDQYKVEKYQAVESNEDGEYGTYVLLFFKGEKQIANVQFRYTFGRDSVSKNRFLAIRGNMKGQDYPLDIKPKLTFNNTSKTVVVHGQGSFEDEVDLKENDPTSLSFSFNE